MDERLLDTVGEQSGLTIDLESDLGEFRLPTETTLYRIVQEALTNGSEAR